MIKDPGFAPGSLFRGSTQEGRLRAAFLSLRLWFSILRRGKIGAEARQIIGDRFALLGRKRTNQLHVLDIHPRAHTVGRFFELTQEILKALTGEARSQATQFAQAKRAVAVRAVAVVDDVSFARRRSVPRAACKRRPARKTLGIGSDIEQVLRADPASRPITPTSREGFHVVVRPSGPR